MEVSNWITLAGVAVALILAVLGWLHARMDRMARRMEAGFARIGDTLESIRAGQAAQGERIAIIEGILLEQRASRGDFGVPARTRRGETARARDSGQAIKTGAR